VQAKWYATLETELQQCDGMNSGEAKLLTVAFWRTH